MSTFGYVSLSIFAGIAAVILLTALFAPILRKIGFRNISRRISNTVLVVIGSLVGAALISGSFVLSDSLDKTFYEIVERGFGEMDLTITLSEKTMFPGGIAYVSDDDYKKVEDLLDIPEVDGILPDLAITVSPQKLDSDGNPLINAYNVSLQGIDLNKVASFGKDGQKFESLTDNEVLISDSLAKKMELSEGDMIRAPFGPLSIDMKVKKIYPEKGLIGGKTILARDEFLAGKLNLPVGSYNNILVSATGGIRPDNYDGKAFEDKIKEQLDGFNSDSVTLITYEWKQEALNGFGMKTFVNIFFVLSLFGIFSGILLIVNLYSMLAEERKMEMGILRAIALTRVSLAKTFIYEGFVYSLISSFFGSFVGLGIGYALVKGLARIFEMIGSVSGDEDFFQIVFGFKVQSLVIAFCLGFIITIVTSVVSSLRISRLNIVSAIRNLEEKKKIKVTPKWMIRTIKQATSLRFKLIKFTIKSPIKGLLRRYPTDLAYELRKQKEDRKTLKRWNIVTFLNSVYFFFSLGTLGLFFVIRDMMIAGREAGGENNQLAQMTQKQFEDQLSLTQGFLLYFGVVVTIFLGVGLVNRAIGFLLQKDWRRITVTIACVINIVFTSLITQFDSMKEAYRQEAGIVLFFVSGIVMVVSFSLIITYNLSAITGLLSVILAPIGKLRSIVRIALRYPAESRMRTGLTLIMFALIIYLIAYVSMVRATMNVEIKNTLENSLGGYDLIVVPGEGVTQDQIEEFSTNLESKDSIESVSATYQTLITLPGYKYKDIPEAPFYNDPRLIPAHTDEDDFRSFYSALPVDYINNTDIELAEREEGYESDRAVWDAVIADPSKIVLGEAFVSQGYGQQPDLKLGDKIEVADLFGENTAKREIIGVIKPVSGQGVQLGLYGYLITTSDHLPEQLEETYIDNFSDKVVFLRFKDDIDLTAETNDVKKELITYNISQITELEEVAGTALNMINALMMMFQGFLAFSLIVGTSGLAIIITRAVQERRQQIGMLRSLGFQRSMVLGSFFIESTFITLLGIVVGLSMGTVGALVAFEIEFGDQPDAQPIFPVTEILLICLAVYVASMIFALLPSIRAARLSPVEATNYPE